LFFVKSKNLAFLLSYRYKFNKKRYPILATPKKHSFYYWTRFSYRKIKSFNINKIKFFGFKFTQFYLTPHFSLLKKNNFKKSLLILKKKIAFLKKTDNIKRIVLFRVGSRAWKKSIFRKKLWTFFNKFHIQKSRHFNKKKFDLYNGKIKKKSTYFLKSTKIHQKKKNKQPINVKHKFNRFFFQNRKVFQAFFGKIGLRQHKFTKMFSNFFKKNTYSLLTSFEFVISNILIRSRFVFTKEQAYDLVRKHLVFVNGSLITNIHYTLTVGDRLQLILNKRFFFFYRRTLSNLQYLKKYTGFRVWRLVRFLSNIHKQPAKNIPNWVMLLMYYRIDVPRFLEVDYTILTSIILYKPMFIFEYNYYNLKFVNYFLIRLYNWKYII
jgi:ribosomal protein S4